jgi:cysteine-rich repeat protein
MWSGMLQVEPGRDGVMMLPVGTLRLTLVMSIAWLGACLQSPLVPCGDTVCPPGNVCTPGGCATPADVDACNGLEDGDGCRAANGGAGTCQGGACKTGLCGNGRVDVGEACDDGNLASGDGCRADCLKIEVCGDGELDAGEACDDGNDNAADGCDACQRTSWAATSVVGTAVSATAAALANPDAVAADGAGRIYIADTQHHRVRRVELDGSVTTIAGIGTPGFSGDGGAATSAQLNEPAAVAVDGVGRVFVADAANHRIRRIDIDGTIVTIAGTGIAGFGGDGAAAIFAQLANPRGLAVDGLGDVIVADTDNHRIRRITDDGTIWTIAGTGVEGFSGDGGPAINAELANPYAVAVDATGRVLIADTLNARVRRIDLDDKISTIAGNGNVGDGGDGGPATAAELSGPTAVAVDAQGVVAIADPLNQRIRRIALDGTMSTIAGTGAQGFGGDGGPAIAAQLAFPFGVAIDGQGRVAIADRSNQRIRRIGTSGTIATVAGSGKFGFGGEGSEATSALLGNPYAVTVDAQGRAYIADTFNYAIRRVELDGTITTVAGTGIAGSGGDGGPALEAQLNTPSGLAIDAQGRLLISDTFNHRIRRIEANGTIVTIAGTGVAGSTGDGGPATSARLSNPNGIAVDGQGRVLISDTYNSRIRRIELDGTIVTVAGTGQAGYDGDGGPATSARLQFPYNVGVDASDRILIADTANHRVRRVATDGTITTIAGTGAVGTGGAGGPATSAQLDTPMAARVDSQGRVVIADGHNHAIRRIELDGTLTTLAGTLGVPGSRGDAALASQARVAYPHNMVVDELDRIVFADTNNSRIRMIAGGTITTIAGRIDPEDVGPVARARLDDPQAIAIGANLTVVAGGTSGTVEAIRGGRVEVVAGRYPHEAATGALARFRQATFGDVGGVVVDPTTGAIYLTETSAHRLHVITQVDPAVPATWTIATLANASGMAGFADGAAATARFRAPTGLYLDSAARTLYIADTGNHAIRALDLDTNTVTTIANTAHSLGYAGDDGPATAARLFRPSALTRCNNGDLFIADTGNHRVRRIAGGEISTVLGAGVAASSGEGAPARTFPVDAPRGLGCDAYGNLYVTSTTAVRLLTASEDGIVDGSGGVQTIYGAPPRDTFPASVTSCLTGLAVTSDHTVQVADACTGLLVELTRSAVP